MSERLEEAVQRHSCCCNVILPGCAVLAMGAFGGWLGARGGWPLAAFGALAGGAAGLVAYAALILASGLTVGAVLRRRKRRARQASRRS